MSNPFNKGDKVVLLTKPPNSVDFVVVGTVGDAAVRICGQHGPLTPGQLRHAEPWHPSDVWDTHPEFTVDAWRAEVRNDETRSGYVAWVNHKLMSEYDEAHS